MDEMDTSDNTRPTKRRRDNDGRVEREVAAKEDLGEELDANIKSRELVDENKSLREENSSLRTDNASLRMENMQLREKLARRSDASRA
jgi:regulator of replication initiation timing